MAKVLTSAHPELIDVRDEEPPMGTQVQALNHGGVLCPVVWGTESKNSFDAWTRLPKVPQSVKERQLARFKL